jgi:hypothetical protein
MSCRYIETESSSSLRPRRQHRILPPAHAHSGGKSDGDRLDSNSQRWFPFLTCRISTGSICRAHGFSSVTVTGRRDLTIDDTPRQGLFCVTPRYGGQSNNGRGASSKCPGNPGASGRRRRGRKRVGQADDLESSRNPELLRHGAQELVGWASLPIVRSDQPGIPHMPSSCPETRASLILRLQSPNDVAA